MVTIWDVHVHANNYTKFVYFLTLIHLIKNGLAFFKAVNTSSVCAYSTWIQYVIIHNNIIIYTIHMYIIILILPENLAQKQTVVLTLFDWNRERSVKPHPLTISLSYLVCCKEDGVIRHIWPLGLPSAGEWKNVVK